MNIELKLIVTDMVKAVESRDNVTLDACFDKLDALKLPRYVFVAFKRELLKEVSIEELRELMADKQRKQ